MMTPPDPHARARHASPLRRPWHIDALIQRRLLRDVAGQRDRLRGRLLDVGCGRRPYARWLDAATDYVGLDMTPAPGGPDVCATAWRLPFADRSFDAVLSTQTIEHVAEPAEAVAEMARVLRPGGSLVLSAPQTWRLHEAPHDYFRFTRYGLAALVERAGLELLEIRHQGGVWMTVGQTINNAIHARGAAPVYARYLAYLASNAVFGALDMLWHDPAETLNYLVVAQKPL